MRPRFTLAALASSCVLGTSYAALAEVTGVTLTANGWDTRIDGFGCAPNGCVPANVQNASIAEESRWSCRASRSLVDVCELTFVLDPPQDIFEMRMAMFKGNERTRTVAVWVDGVLVTTVETSGVTFEYEAYEVLATQATTIVLQEAGLEEDVWLSITGVQLMTDTLVEVSPLTFIPDSDEYVGCFNDVVGDRVLTTVSTYDDLTVEDCAAKCGEMVKYFYGLQQGNECWCAGCEITERDTNTDFDRHGNGVCATACPGDSTAACGGDMSISLYQSTTCLATPAPTPAIAASECPTGSTGASLEIIASWEDSFSGMDLHVIEPGGVEVSNYYGVSKLGDVGMWGDGRVPGEYGVEFPGSESYLTLNGLNVANDAVLGDYEIWGSSYEGTKWTITARSGGELLWIAGGEFAEFQEETERFTATVTSYAESDCTLDDYGKCPSNSYSSDGLPPCEACPEGLVARGGSTYCTDPALRNLMVPENIADAIIADAVGGWAGPGYPDLYDGQRLFKLFVDSGSDLGTVSVSGNFPRDDDTPLPASTALFLYLHNEEDETDFVRGQGEIDPASGNFTATITDFPVGSSRGILSFVLLDPADAGDEEVVYNTVFDMDVINEGCSEALRIKLEWDSNDDLDLWVTDPNGDRVSKYYSKATDIGYINDLDGGGYSDQDVNGSFEEYVLFSGLSGDAMLGEYRIFARSDYAENDNPWTLTATVAGEVVWVEQGVLVYEHSYSDTTDDYSGSSLTSRRNLYTTDDDHFSSTYGSYSATYYPQTETFTVTLDSYDPVGC